MTGRVRAIGRCHRGFTLMELLVSIILLAVILSLLAFPMWSGFAYVERGAARADAQAAGRRAMEAMQRELSEAIYVFDIPPESSMIAFVLPSRGPARVSPPGPELSQLVSPQAFLAAWRLLPAQRQPLFNDAEGKALAIRYWPVLTRFVKDGVWQASEVIARTDVPLGSEHVPAGGREIPLAMDARYPDKDYDPSYSLGDRDKPQPLPVGIRPISVEAAQLISSVTPNELGYEVPLLRFAPDLVEKETLRPTRAGGSADFGVYRGRLPLWQRFSTHTVGDDPFANLGEVMVYRRPAPGEPYELKYHSKIEPATKRVYIVERVLQNPPLDGPPIYFLDSYPVRDAATQPYAFGINYDRGAVLFSFPQPSYPLAERLQFRPGTEPGTAQALLKAIDRDGDGTPDDPDARIVRASETLKVDAEVLGRVPSTMQPSRGQYTIDYETGAITVDASQAGGLAEVTYLWRNNRDDDLVVATYQSKGLITVAFTVGKRTRRTNLLEVFHLSTQVELANATR